MIIADAIGKRFGETVALNRVSFIARDGEAVALLGPNGAGKTTMIRILTGLIPPSEGRIVVDGMPMDDDPLFVKKRLGYLPENNPLYGDMEVSEYLRFAAEMKDVPKNELESSVDRVIHDCGLGGWEKRRIGKLSKGYKQRVGLAQALVNDPACVILDEPTSGLDPGQIVEFREMIRGLKGKRTVLLSTHILSDASSVCDKVVVLKKGRIVAEDSVEEIGKRLRPAAEWSLTVAGPEAAVKKAFQEIPGLIGLSLNAAGKDEWEITAATEKHYDPRQEFVRAIVAKDLRLLEMHAGKIGLEEVFIELMAEDRS